VEGGEEQVVEVMPVVECEYGGRDITHHVTNTERSCTKKPENFL
jgi:hypothetical protein